MARGESGKPDPGKQDAREPDVGGQDASEPDTREPDASEPDASEPDAREPDAREQEAGGRDVGGQDPGGQGPGEQDAREPELGEPDVGGVDVGGRDAGGVDVGGVDAGDQDVVADVLAAAELAGRVRDVPLGVVAGRVAESLPPGPDLAGWLAAAADPRVLEDGALAGVAASWRRLAAWAQAGELAAVAQIASRSAARDERIGADAAGCPARVPDEAAAQVSLALVMSAGQAAWWTDLGVMLGWQLAATGAALAAGVIDLSRARLIAEAAGVLGRDAARAVEAQVLPQAGELTTGGLRAALRRAVIAADPQGADRRREQAQARAKVMLYPDAEGTATLAGYSLPGVGAVAAMARIGALARALKASGASGGIDLLRAQVFLGLLCGTLPLIPPPSDAPPDDPPPDDDQPPDDQPPGASPGHPPPQASPGDPPPGAPPGNQPPGNQPPGDPPPQASPDDQPPGAPPGDPPPQASPGDPPPGASPGDPPAGDPPAGDPPAGASAGGQRSGRGVPARRRPPRDVPAARLAVFRPPGSRWYSCGEPAGGRLAAGCAGCAFAGRAVGRPA